MSEDLENKVFQNGRHRDKTYLYVYENDKKFCQKALSGESNRSIPDDFLEFLLQKDERSTLLMTRIEVRTAPRFIKEMNEAHFRLLRRLIGKADIKFTKVHPTVRTILASNGFLGVFHRFFGQKHIANVASVDCRYKYFEEYMSIFPFPVSDRVTVDETCIDEIFFNMDEELTIEMQQFLDDHFDGAEIEVRSVIRKLFANIVNCKDKNVPQSKIIAAVKELNLKGISGEGDVADEDDDDPCEYLKNYPRVNVRGVSRYQKIYKMIIDVLKLYGKSCTTISDTKYESNYLRKLPEINFYELYSLLNVDFMKQDRTEYSYRLKKYLFFFANALNNPKKPVFFIDDGLFECLQCYSVFRKSRQDAETLKYELSMLSLVYRRKQNFDENRASFRVDDENLLDIKNYLSNFPAIVDASVNNEIHCDVLESKVFVTVDEVALDLGFRVKACNQVKSFFELIIHGALASTLAKPIEIKRLIIYNAFRGEETSMEMPSSKEQIVEFLQKHNGYDFQRKFPAEMFIIDGFEDRFEGDVGNWDSKVGFIL